MDPLLAALAICALAVGATGTWSPCGLSMIETIGPTGHTGGLRTTFAASATFAPFAAAGGMLTFGALALAGSLLGGPGTVAYGAAAAIAAAAAVAEARGVAIVPQVRRQLPVRWRSRYPMPLAAAGYGVLLGLGFTTFVLSYGVWALGAIALALGEPLAGAVIGLGFGIGRALPIVALAPLADRPAGERACEAMVMRPGIYRGARAGDAVALALVAVALGGSAAAVGADRVERRAADPSVSGSDLAFQRQRNGAGVLRRPGGDRKLPGGNPALGGAWVAVTDRDGIAILDRDTLEQVGQVRAGNADAVAISRRFVAWRARRGGKDTLRVAALADPADPGPRRMIARARGPAQLGRPALAGGMLAWAKAKPRKNKLIRAKLRNRRKRGAEAGDEAGATAARIKVRRRTIRSSRLEALSNPSLRRGRIAYVETDRRKQRVRVGRLRGGKGRTVYDRRTGRGTVWSLALDRRRVYITLIKGGGALKLISARR